MAVRFFRTQPICSAPVVKEDESSVRKAQIVPDLLQIAVKGPYGDRIFLAELRAVDFLPVTQTIVQQ